ncbi:MAG TPA: NDP-sugar synthase [Solirubrobacteraceae bacterium]|jgi:NDP-sugar pyrophosphorylase family protein
MNAMILAAGRGTRLGELGQTIPKALVDVGGQPLLARQISYLKDGGIDRIVVNAHHLADQIERFVAEHPLADDIDVIFEPELLGTAGGVRNALSRLGEEPFLVLYGDVIVDEPVVEMSRTHRGAVASATITLYQTEEVEGKGTVELADDGTVSKFHEKTTSHVDGPAYVNAGLYVVDPSLLRDLPPSTALDFGHDVFPTALARGSTIMAHILASPVIDVGTPAMLELARNRLG